MGTPILSSFYAKTYTASSDAEFRVEDDSSVILTSINIHCYTNDAAYGNAGTLQGILRANSIVWFDAPCRVSDLIFKNYVAGSNTTIVITGTLPIR